MKKKITIDLEAASFNPKAQERIQKSIRTALHRELKKINRARSENESFLKLKDISNLSRQYATVSLSTNLSGVEPGVSTFSAKSTTGETHSLRDTGILIFHNLESGDSIICHYNGAGTVTVDMDRDVTASPMQYVFSMDQPDNSFDLI